MKRIIPVTLFAMLIIMLLTACNNAAAPSADEAPSMSPLSYSDFAGKRVGVEPGSVFDIITESIGGIPVFFNDMSAGIEDLRNYRIDGVVTDLAKARLFLETPGNEDVDIAVIPDYIFSAPIAAMSASQEVIDRFNSFLSVIKADGTLEDMQNRWINTTADLDAPMLVLTNSGSNGRLIVAISGVTQPFTYIGANDEPKGFSVELALRFGVFEDVEIIFERADFGGYIPLVMSGKADIGIDAYYITEERKQSVLFSEPYAEDLCAVLYLKPVVAGSSQGSESGGFISWLKTGIERNLLTDNRWQMVLNGLGVTMTIAFFAQIIGTVFGCFVCWVLTRKNRFVNLLGRFYCGLIHGTPVVVLLMITYYIIFGSTTISNVVIAIAAFSMVVGASVAQNLKGAIETVDPVEIEAARSIGFSAFRAFLTVTFPQAVKRALPVYTNGFVELVKATAVVGYIAIQDLTRAGDIIRSRTYDAFFPLLFIALIYLLVTTVCVQLFKLIIRKVNGGVSQ